MAKKDVNLYFLEMQHQYNQMLTLTRQLDEECKKGNVEQALVDTYMTRTEALKENYDRIAYIVMLLNKPKQKNNQKADVYKQWYNALKGASKEVLLDENKDVLVDLKKLLIETQEANKKQ